MENRITNPIINFRYFLYIFLLDAKLYQIMVECYNILWQLLMSFFLFKIFYKVDFTFRKL